MATAYDSILVQNFHCLKVAWKKCHNLWRAEMSSSVHFDNKGKDILMIGEGSTQKLYDITLTAEDIYPTNFTQPNKRFVLSLHYNGRNSFLFVNAKKYISIQNKRL